MSTVRVTHSIDKLADDLKTITTSTPRRMAGVVRDAAQRGNRNARAFADVDHTMFSDVDADYPPSFTVGRIAALIYEFGSDHPKATGYEFGSINQASPHRNFDRARDIEAVEFPMDVSDEMRLIWQQAGF